MKRPQIALVSAPFSAINWPSIQLGLLKAHCAQADIPVACHYINLDFAASIGCDVYNALARMRGPLLGEWIFSRACFPEHEKAESFPQRFGELLTAVSRESGTSAEQISALRETLALGFVEQSAQKLAKYKIVGFSSTFQQNVASLAIAKRIKALNPECTTLFGGANFENPMGQAYLSAFPWIDVYVSGEADSVVVQLFSQLLQGQPVEDIPGVFTRAGLRTARGPSRLTFNGQLDDLPVPDYDDYFVQLRANGLSEWNLGYPLFLPFESSRGCWWGQKHHCTFCGLNGGGMGFRAKSPARAADELSGLARKYNVRHIHAVDNIIATKGLEEFCARLKSMAIPLEIFYEVKANLKPETIRLMAEAGINNVQPGIENFSDNVLALMRKGITGLHNVNSLRWLTMSGVGAGWNLLYGFPGESSADYSEQVDLFSRIHHLPPPLGVVRMRVDRFSPNFEDPVLRSQFAGIRPEASYEYIYPKALDLDQAAYSFEGVAPNSVSDSDIAPLSNAAKEWSAKWSRNGEMVSEDERPFLIVESAGEGARVLDGRDRRSGVVEIMLSRLEADLYEQMFNRPENRAQLIRLFCERGYSESIVMEGLAKFEIHKIAFQSGDRILALALRRGSPVNLEKSPLHRPAPQLLESEAASV